MLRDESYTLRPGTADDLDQVVAIEAKSIPEPWARSHFEAEMVKPFARFWVLTDDETDSKVAGYIVFWLMVDGCSLLDVAVDPEFRGQGMGEKMLRAMINEVVRQEYARLVLEVRASNESALRLYKKVGFKETHRRTKFYSDGEDAIVMELKTSDVTGAH